MPELIKSASPSGRPLEDGTSVRGWTILSKRGDDAMQVIAAARRYEINHLQLSHHLVMDLREMRDTAKRARVCRLIDAAHDKGIQEVVLWDHALYGLDYYPTRFRTGPGGTLDLDNADFWAWFAQDYRDMLDLVPNANGLVLTFVETGARAEAQHSNIHTTPAARLAAVVKAVAAVVIGERGLNLYIRTFSYTHAEYAMVIGAVNLLRDLRIRLMMKETPHDFFFTHPDDMYAGTLDLPTIMEFDTGNEFNGQGIIANTWPEYVLRRAHNLLYRPHVIGYVGRTDRYGDTRIVGRAGEVLLHALKRCAEDRNITSERVSDEFIEARYGAAAARPLAAAFSKAYEIVNCVLYTLGTSTANHSKLNYDPYPSSYARHVSGKWIDPPIVHMEHGINRSFHYWADVIEHLAPARFKASKAVAIEAPFVLENRWLTHGEQMNAEYLAYILVEKGRGVSLAQQALADVVSANNDLAANDYIELHELFERTLLTACLHRAASAAYFGYRIWSRGAGHQSSTLLNIIWTGLEEMKETIEKIEAWPAFVPAGQWTWREDAAMARNYLQKIGETGWDEYGPAVPPIDPAAFAFSRS